MQLASWMSSWLPSTAAAYSALDVLVLALAVAAAADRRARWRMSSGLVTQCLAAMLAVLAFSSGGGLGMAAQVHVLAVLGLPVLAQHPVGSIAFQLASLAGAHRAIYGGSGPWQAGTAAALHAALVAANLDPQSRATLGVLATKLLLVQEIHLIRLSRLRTLTLDDIWPLPERYRMDAIRHEFHYNIDEPLFLVRAALRMVWRPLLPLVIVDSMLQMLDVVAIVAEARMLRCLDSPADYPWYQGYLAALTVCLVRLVQELHPRVKDHIAAEVGRVRRAVELELFRIPLTRGSTDAQVPYYSGYFVDCLGRCIRDVTDLVSYIAVACASIATVYGIIGPLVLIPVVVCVMVMLASDGFEALVGPIWNWQRGYRGRYDGTVDSIYHNIKAIKLFGWERMFTDPELCYRETDGELLPWYAPAVVFAWWAIHAANSLIAQLSAYAVVYIYTQRGAFRTLFATDADMFRLNNHIRDIILHLYWIWYGMQNLRRFFAENFDAERRMVRKSGHRLPQSAAASKTGSAVDMCDCSFVWSKWARKPVLTDVSLSASSGELVAVVGKTGSGKSSLLLAICGELEMTAGTGGLVGTVGYLEQSPWIMCATLRANILFGREYDAAFLAKVIYACALADDIAQWPDGDLAVIGERGINLSGGQRARLALARTLYSRADIYILDDPLSAVDAHVKRHILDHVLLDSGMLAGKLRVVATHVHQILPFAHQVVRLDDGRATVTAQCPQAYSPAADPQLLSSGYLSESSTTTAVNTAPPSPTVASPVPPTDKDKDKDKDKKPETCVRSNAVYAYRLCGALALAGVALMSQLEPVLRFVLDKLQLKTLRQNAGGLDRRSALTYMQLAMVGTFLDFNMYRVKDMVSEYVVQRGVVENIKGMFVGSIIYAPLSLYDSTTRAQLSEAFNYGATEVSADISPLIMRILGCVTGIALSVFHVGASVPQLLLLVPLIAWTFSRCDVFLDPVSAMLRDIRRAAGIGQGATSNIIADGKRMIRLYGVEPFFTRLHMQEGDAEQRIELPADTIDMVSYIATSSVCAITNLSTVCLLLLQSQLASISISSGEFLTYKRLVYSLVNQVSKVAYMPGRLRKLSCKMDTYRAYTDIPPEAPLVVEGCRPPPSWPQAGKIEFCNYTMRYRKDLEPTLSEISITIQPGEKIGIVGRTGAGKSTLVKSLFRLVHGTTTGQILIDGQDILEMGVGDLRPRLGIIPQESSMFSGSLKRNLDPLREYTIEDMWAALVKSGIAPKVAPPRASKDEPSDDIYRLQRLEDYNEAMADHGRRWAEAGWKMRLMLLLFASRPRKPHFTPRKLLHGLDRMASSNDLAFSGGEQQLFSLCRVLMRMRRVIVLDEATADVDLETDRHMQQVFRDAFAGCTVLTIAHRLETVMGSDRIIVMDKGRIAEIGTPQELIDAGGIFAELVSANDFGP